MERSADLRGFIQFRGAPSALAVESSFIGPLTIALFYPNKNQVYTLETLENTWYISEPAKIDSESARIVNSITSGMRGEAVLLSGAELAESTGMPLPTQLPPGETGLAVKRKGSIPGVVPGAFTSPQTDSPQLNPQQNSEQPGIEDPPKPPLDTPLPMPVHTPRAQSRSTKEQKILNAPTSDSEHSFLVALAAKAPDVMAEISPKGDLVHYVTLPAETLEAITRWYTFDAANTARIRRINQLPATGLAQGDQVVIPAYLIKNKKRLDEGSLRQLLQ